MNRMFIDLILERIFSKSFPWRSLLLMVALGFFVATMVSSILSPGLVPSTQSLKNSSRGFVIEVNELGPKSKVRVNHGAMSKQILQRNIFNLEGKVAEEDVGELDPSKAAQENMDGPVKSKLPFKLVGTIYGGDPLSGLAVLIDKSKGATQNSFLVGDFLAGDIRLAEVYRERIIVRNKDRLEYIALERKEIQFAKPRKVGRRASTSGRERKIRRISNEYKEEGFARVGQSITMSKEYRKNLIENDLARVLQDAKAVPAYGGDGDLMGFRLTNIKDNSIYQKAGLINQDVVKEINGVSLRDARQAISLLQSLRGESDIEIKVDRSGSIVNINMQVQ